MINLEDIFGPKGILSKNMPGFENRPEQKAMAAAIDKSIESESHLIVEAGTGIGKSFAYLIPAVLQAKENDLRVVISTNTISLQEQLIAKDIPFLKNILPVDFRAVLAKGRENYVCLRRLEMTSHLPQSLLDSDEEERELQQIINWAYKTRDGSLSEIDPVPPRRLWTKVCCEHQNCLGSKCKFYGHCFFQRERKKMFSADVIIVNHHLFFVDLALRQAGANILPNFDILILDEAHAIEDTAAKHLGIDVSNSQLKYFYDRLYQKKKNRGFLVGVESDKARDLVSEARRVTKKYFEQVDQWIDKDAVRKVSEPFEFEKIIPPVLNNLVSELQTLRKNSKNKDTELELSVHIERAKGLAESLAFFSNMEYPNHVYWVEISGKRQKRIALTSAPIDVGDMLRPMLFEKVAPIIMTSATMSISRKGDFEYFKNRIGLKDCDELVLGSPFDYMSQVELYVEKNMPPPNLDPQKYREALPAKIMEYIEKTDGHAFVLFTSYSLLDQTFNALAPELEYRGHPVFRQGGDIPRSRMLDQFRRNPRSILFGTDTFWEGVDVQGAALQNVIITRLPFAVPAHPLTEARVAKIRERGGNSFMEYSVPEAIIRFRQGFGRLIRTSKDKGIVVILDSRVLTKQYGKMFLEAIPKCHTNIALNNI